MIADGLKRELNHYQTKFKFDGRKCLAVFVNVTHFKEAKDGPKYPQRSAADQDHVQMAKTLSDLVDCEIINALQTEKDKSKSNILKHLQKVADIYKNGDYGFLLLIFSSHGGTDSQGQFFVSSDIERIYCKEVRQIFACSRGSKIGRKPVIFIFTSCRHFVPDVNSLTPANPLNENELAIPGNSIHSQQYATSNFVQLQPSDSLSMSPPEEIVLSCLTRRILLQLQFFC